MGTDNAIFLEVIEWFDPTGQEMLHRIPEEGSGEIKYGAQLTVRESQVGVFFYQGRAIQAFGPGRHTLKTANIPILNKLMSLPWGLTSPLRAEVYFINMKVFTNLKWGTRDPVAFKDEELGLIRLRAHGIQNVRVIQPLLFINSLVGTLTPFTTGHIEEYMSQIVVSRLNDTMGERLRSILDLPGQYEAWADGLKEKVQEDLGHFGLGLTHLYIGSITPPTEVQKSIDDRSKLALFQDLNKLLQLKAANALEKAAEAGGGASEGLGLGLGLIMPSLVNQMAKSPDAGASAAEMAPQCPDCGHTAPRDSKFCPLCGHQLLVFTRCPHCGKNLPPNARFCPRCGTSVEVAAKPRKCPRCETENLPQALFCNHCGERL